MRDRFFDERFDASAKRQRLLNGCASSALSPLLFCNEQQQQQQGRSFSDDEPDNLNSSVFSSLIQPNYRTIEVSSSSSSPSSSRRDDSDTFWRTMANDMAKLSIHEREIAYDDVHGTREMIDETDDLIIISLLELDDAIHKIHNKSAYDIALSQNPAYVEDDNFRLRFLRCNEFHVQEAAQQIIDHFDNKRSLFGDEPLGRALTLDDLDEEDMKCLTLGFFQVLPEKDRSGRTIFLSLHMQMATLKPLNIIRTYFYQAMASLEDEDVQRYGVIYIHWAFGSPFGLGPRELEIAYRTMRAEKSLGIRPCSIQYCGPGKKLHPLMDYGMNLSMMKSRVRFKAHLGSHVETLYSLASYGIAGSMIPVDSSNVPNLSGQQNWIENRRAVENQHKKSISRASPTFTSTLFDEINTEPLQPRADDVLFGGNTKEFYQSPGNIYFQSLVEELESEYNNSNCSKKEKGALCEQIIANIKAKTGRFLLFESSGGEEEGRWTLVDDAIARKRITQAFRNRRRTNKDTR